MISRVITLTGLPFPKAEVQSLDYAAGLLVFRWLDAGGSPVDSGGSVATFASVAPLPSEDPLAAPEYPEIDDETLADAIAAAVNAPAPVPQIITRAEFVIAARRVLGLVEGDVFALISQLPAGETQETARDLWENAREFHRDNSFLAALAQLNGNTPEEIDEVFRVGATLDLG
jgi:hypothetical protein